MDGENGRRLNTNANRGEKITPPFSIVNSDRSSSSSRTEGERNQEGNGISPSKISDSSLYRNGKSHAPISIITESPESIKRSSDSARDSFVLTVSPVIQVMERPKTSGHNRVPSSTDSPNRWSVDSGDSLFSIRMGNDSFSKDHSLRISGDMNGIGELSLSEAYLPRGGELYNSNSNSPAAAKAIDEEAVEEAKQDDKPVFDQQKCDPPEASSISMHTDSNLSRSSDPNASSRDDNKNQNDQSFASPSTSASSACPMCQPLCCDRMSCCFKWPSCSCCRWPSCSCSDWFRWPSCCNTCLSCPSCCSCFSKCCGSISCCSSCCNNFNQEARVSSYALMNRGVASSSKHNL